MNDVPTYEDFQAEAPSTNELTQLSALANDLYLAELAESEASEVLKLAQAKVRDIAEHQIPELMDQIGLEEFKTKSGIKLAVKDVLRTSIPAARRPEAFEWLRERNFGDIIKRTVAVGFGRDEGEAAQALSDDLILRGLRVKDDEKIESSTLKKFVGDQLEAGGEMPMELFGVSQFRRAKITAKPASEFGD